MGIVGFRADCVKPPVISILSTYMKTIPYTSLNIARVAELADALDLGSSGYTMRVRVPPLAPTQPTREFEHMYLGGCGPVNGIWRMEKG